MNDRISKLDTPKTTHSYSDTLERREELPFRLQVEKLAYIGIMSRQTWEVGPHYHEHFELCYVAEGSGWFVAGDVLLAVEQGDLFLTKPREPHFGAASGDAPFQLYYLGFDLERFGLLESNFLELGTIHIVSDPDELVKGLCDEIFKEIGGGDIRSDVMAEGLFMQLLVHVLRLYRSAAAALPIKDALSPVVKRILTRLHETTRFEKTNRENRLTIEELAGDLHVSRTHLEREFRRFMGVPLGRYIRDLQLDRAKRRLKDTDESVTEIAASLEYESIHAFSVFFKRGTGLSPTEYRIRARRVHDDEKR